MDMITITDDELKKIQKLSLEMAEYIFDFCKKYDIRVYMFAGSLLGAVRHHGFIPWDDDIDIIFPAPDFKKFTEMWEKYADKDRYSLCLQSKNYNDHTLSGSVRDNYTTFITDSTVNYDVNQGLAIDLGAVHACPDTKFGRTLQLIFAAGRSLFKAGRLPARQSRKVYLASKVLLSIFKGENTRYFIWSNLEKLASIPDKTYDKHKYSREFSMFPYITWCYERKWFDSQVWVPFEDAEVPIPVGAHEYLTKRYGNYMEFPPEKDRRPEHRIVFMDLDTPYKKYRGKKYYVKQGEKNG